MMKIEVHDLSPDADREEFHHYSLSGLNNYWLAPVLFEINEDGDLRLLEFDNIQAAIGIHICELQRPLGPREIRFLRGEMGFSQTDLGIALGYRDKQRVLSAEKLSEDRKPLNTPADMLLRRHYLGMIGKHDLVGDDYRNAAIAMSEALNRPMQPVDDIDHLVAA